FGCGRRSLVHDSYLSSILESAQRLFVIASGAEITIEANPDSLTRDAVQELSAGGFNRISMGMQSALPHVLEVLERTHNPAKVASATQWIREAGLYMSLDLIFGTPGETLQDWQISLDAVLQLQPDHISDRKSVV